MTTPRGRGIRKARQYSGGRARGSQVREVPRTPRLADLVPRTTCASALSRCVALDYAHQVRADYLRPERSGR